MPKPVSANPPPAQQRQIRLRLYVSGDAPNSVSANAKAICEKYFPARSDLEVVDLIVDPLQALADGIIVTPTLIRLLPLPARRIVGNLNDTTKVLLALGDA